MRAQNLGVGDFPIGCADPQNDTPTIERCVQCERLLDSDELVDGLCTDCEPAPKFHHEMRADEDEDLTEWIAELQQESARRKQ